jgi:Na+-transporting NADH:ubiquinone oxidoreductase subunit C
MVNIQFFDHKETPGLGARIEENWFTSQFKGLKIAWNKPEKERVIVGPSPDPNAANRVDAITGATQTSTALMRFLNQELEKIRSLNLGMNRMARTNDAAR